MTVLYVAYIVAGSLAVLSVAFAILNWIAVARVSARIAELETGIEKKALEFDTLRKERSAGPVVPAVDAVAVVEGPAQEPQSAATAQIGDETSEIQVFRNVRGTFAQSPAQIAVAAPPPVEQAEPEPGPVADAYAPPVSAQSGSSPPSQQAAEQGAVVPQPADESSEVMDVVADSGAGDAASTASPDVLKVKVFSDTRRDADFDAMSRELRERFPRVPNPRVILDFSNVFFLYEQELVYLATIERFIRGRNGTLSLVRCEGELRATLLKHPLLAACVKA